MKNQYMVSFCGEYARIEADTEAEALQLAQDDYHLGSRGRVEDWKECEYEEKWVTIKL